MQTITITYKGKELSIPQLSKKLKICHDTLYKRYHKYGVTEQLFEPLVKVRTHCPHGHKMTAKNTYIRPDRKGRKCKICLREQYIKRRYGKDI